MTREYERRDNFFFFLNIINIITKLFYHIYFNIGNIMNRKPIDQSFLEFTTKGCTGVSGNWQVLHPQMTVSPHSGRTYWIIRPQSIYCTPEKLVEQSFFWIDHQNFCDGVINSSSFLIRDFRFTLNMEQNFFTSITRLSSTNLS